MPTVHIEALCGGLLMARVAFWVGIGLVVVGAAVMMYGASLIKAGGMIVDGQSLIVGLTRGFYGFVIFTAGLVIALISRRG